MLPNLENKEGRTCTKCKRDLPFSEFHKHSARPYGCNSMCKTCRRNSPIARRLYYYAKKRAKKNGREFSICVTDIVIPPMCPVLGIYMDSPSLDRIDSARGYAKDNVRVISARANMLKNNATIEELELVLRDLKST